MQRRAELRESRCGKPLTAFPVSNETKIDLGSAYAADYLRLFMHTLSSEQQIKRMEHAIKILESDEQQKDRRPPPLSQPEAGSQGSGVDSEN
jgi:hypothetical protein